MRCILCTEQLGRTFPETVAHFESAHPAELAVSRAQSRDALLARAREWELANSPPILQEWEEAVR